MQRPHLKMEKKQLFLNAFIILTTVCVTNTETASDKLIFLHQKNKPISKVEPLNGPCCVLPLCTHTQCYQTISCGNLCAKKELLTQTQDYRTSGYKIRIAYTKTDCHFEKCHTFQHTCHHCPDPNKDNFNIQRVNKICKPCYYL
uniref:Uncharacterized protein LOC114348276 n=1 Tax=Diabrotica virgifera virgifera TaxID=50390 RepID=A0A6P7HG28_DIAVI